MITPGLLMALQAGQYGPVPLVRDIDFGAQAYKVNNVAVALADVMSFNRTGGAGYITPAGQYAFQSAANAPCLEGVYNTATGTWEAAGVAIRPAAKNWIPNGSWAGYVAGGPGTSSGTVGTGHQFSALSGTGLTRKIELTTVDGVPVLRLTLAGTTAATGTIRFEMHFSPASGAGVIPAQTLDDQGDVDVEGVALSQTWTSWVFCRLSAGSTAGVLTNGLAGSIQPFVREANSGGTLNTAYGDFVPDALPLLSRPRTASKTLNQTGVTTVRPGIRMEFQNNVAVNITLDFALPGTDKGAAYPGPILTAGSPVFRSIETAAMLLPNGGYDTRQDGGASDWLVREVVVGGGRNVIPLVGESRIKRLRTYPAGRLTNRFRDDAIGASLPTPAHQVSARFGITLDGNGRVARWDAPSAGSYAIQADPAQRPYFGQDEHGPYVLFTGAETLKLYGVPGLISSFTILITGSADNDGDRMTILGQEALDGTNTTGAVTIELNGFAGKTAAAAISGAYICVSPTLTTFASSFVLLYSRIGPVHLLGYNGDVGLAPQYQDARPYTGNAEPKTIGRRAAGSQPFKGKLRNLSFYTANALSSYQSRLAMRGALSDWRIIPPINEDVFAKAGFVTDGSFLVASDFIKPGLVRLLVSTSPTDFSALVYTSPWTATTPTQGQGAQVYNSVKIAVPGLSPATDYYWGFEYA